ncbi:MAG: hypothetical protein KDD61_03905 [Bdellovibrionales bacterium]|nr:hypothetical protein [Bdellovibrionales bacterium]
MESLIERINLLKTEGYEDNLLIQNGTLRSESGQSLNVSDTAIDQTYRIEDDSDPTHQTVIYAVTCKNPNIKGIIINSFGPISEPEKDQIIEQLTG